MIRKLESPVEIVTDLGIFNATHRQFRFNYDGETITSSSVLGFVLNDKFRALVATMEQFPLTPDDTRKIATDLATINFAALADLHEGKRVEAIEQRAETTRMQEKTEADMKELNERQAAESIAAEKQREEQIAAAEAAAVDVKS